MRILIAGNWHWLQYEQAFADALIRAGHEVVPFSYGEYFQGPLERVERPIPFSGPALKRLNRALISAVEGNKPAIVIVWRGTHVVPQTVAAIRSTGAMAVSYCNDDPFGPLVHRRAPWHHRFLWRRYLKSIPEFDLTLVYRPINVEEALAAGARRVSVLRPYFIPSQDRPVMLTAADRGRFETDVVFIGHYEPDERVAYLRALADTELKVRLFGGAYWTPQVLGRDLYTRLGQPVPLFGEDYTKAVCAAKVGLGFLSKLNRDTYTRRCFEIPACGRVLLCERSEDLARMFVENEEAVFFSSQSELVEKARWLVSNDAVRERIAAAGQRRVWTDGHDVDSRVRQFLSLLSNAEATAG